MKTFVTFLICSIALTAIAEDQIRLVRHGKNVTERPRAVLTTNIIELLQSCSVSSTAYAVKAETWRELQRSDSFVQLTFAAPRKLKVMLTADTGPRSREDKTIDQILVPLPEGAWPLHIYAMSGTNVFSCTKYDPIALRLVAFEPALHLSSVAPYASLAHLHRPNK